MNSEKKVFTYGLSEEENAKVRKALPSKEYGLIDTECITSLLANHYTAVILNTDAMVQDEMTRCVGITWISVAVRMKR